MKVLVLNADYQPYSLWPWKKAMHKWLGNKSVIPIESSGKKILSGGGKEWFIPSIVILKEYQEVTNRPAPYSKNRIYNRDKYKCQYCGDKFPRNKLTIDHVIPKSLWKKQGMKGSPSNYTNVVTACLKCNAHKADKSLQQANMKLLSTPKTITYQQSFVNELLMNDVAKEWWVYLESFVKQNQ